jgi:hypothetical protein
MNKVDWRAVILKIKKERKWKLKTVAYNMDIVPNTLHRWMRGESEPKYSQGAFLLRLAGIDG